MDLDKKIKEVRKLMESIRICNACLNDYLANQKYTRRVRRLDLLIRQLRAVFLSLLFTVFLTDYSDELRINGSKSRGVETGRGPDILHLQMCFASKTGR